MAIVDVARGAVRPEPDGSDPSRLGIARPGVIRRNLATAGLYEEILRRGEATLVEGGAVNATTGRHTGRSPSDKYTVREDSSADRIWWENNQALDPEKFAVL